MKTATLFTGRVLLATLALNAICSPALAEQLPQLDQRWFASQLFWLAVTFGVLYLSVSRFIVPRLQDILESRQSRITHDVDRAEELNTEARKIRYDYEKQISAARSKAQELLSASLQSAQKESLAREQAADAEISAMLSDAEKRIAARREEALNAITPAIHETAQSVLAKLLPSHHTKLSALLKK
jgi:F-type H+-transporting ATPase subunit b